VTKYEARRISAFRHIGCIITGSTQYDVHHLVEGYRLGDRYTIPLHPWFHRAVNFEGMRPSECEARFGPSLARYKKAFEKRYGTEQELLEKVDKMLARYLQ
jgi:hypothetical protein